jgi:endo-1,4-beta-xylanase
MKRSYLLNLLVLFCIPLFICCGKDDDNSGTKPPVVIPTDTTKIGNNLKTAPFPVGAAVSLPNLTNSAKYIEAVKREYTSITAENDMKMGRLWKSRYVWDFSKADVIVNFAVQNNIRMHGHCLVWYKQSETSMPAWILTLHNSGWGTKEDWKQLLKEHITAVVGHFKGKVASWDVVNESIKDDGSERPEDIWREHIGYPDYIDWAFRCAHEIDPDAVLFYNDYGYEYASGKRDKTDALIKGMLERGVPIHGYGIQMHADLPNRSEGRVKDAILRAARLGVKIHVSEIDIQCNPDGANPSLTYTDALKKKQAGLYNEVSASMANLPKAQQWGITQWNVADASSSLSNRPDWPYLLGSDYLPKNPAYYYFVKGFNGQYIPWSTILVNPVTN